MSASALVLTGLLASMPDEHVSSVSQANDELAEGFEDFDDFLNDDFEGGDAPMPQTFHTYHLTDNDFDKLVNNKIVTVGRSNPMFYWDESDKGIEESNVSFTWDDALKKVDVKSGTTLGYDTTMDASAGGDVIKSIETTEIAEKFRDYGVYPVDSSVYGLSSTYGPRMDPISGKEKVFHTGLDIWSTNINKKNIYSMLPGAVSLVEYNESGYGNHVVIDHGNFKTLYAHMDEKPSVEIGQIISAGDKLGIVGTTGRSTGPHLHLEIDVNGVKIDPQPFMSLVGKPGDKNSPKKEYNQSANSLISDNDNQDSGENTTESEKEKNE